MAKITFNLAVSKLASVLHSSHTTIEQTLAKVGAMRTEAVNMVIDAGLAAKKTAAEISEPVNQVFDESVAKGELSPATAKAYKSGLTFALANGVPWTPSLHTLDAQVAAYATAGRSMPKKLREKVEAKEEKVAAKEGAKRGARTPAAKAEPLPPTGEKVTTKAELTGMEMHLVSLWRRGRFGDIVQLAQSEADKTATL